MLHKYAKAITILISGLVLSTPLWAHKARTGDEWRLGLLRHDTKINRGGFERSFALNTERLWRTADVHLLKGLWRPRPHVGLNLNTGHRTSSLYLGLTWNTQATQGIFGELSLGGAVHNGKLKRLSAHRKAQGSRVLFRETLALGYVCPNHETLSLYVEHQSNCKLASPNPGITSVGIRFGIPLNSAEY